LWWPDAADRRLWDEGDAFLLGDALLVAPVLEPGAAERDVLLPGGVWYDHWTDEALAGPGSVRRDAPLERLPLLVRAGSVLPMLEPANATSRLGRELISLHVYAPAEGAEGVSELYTDEGEGHAYREGAWRLDRYTLRREGGRLRLGWTSEGAWPWPWAEVELVLHAGRPLARVWIDGAKADVEADCCIAAGPFREAVFELD
jgi:alpha-glucosidase